MRWSLYKRQLAIRVDYPEKFKGYLFPLSNTIYKKTPFSKLVLLHSSVWQITAYVWTGWILLIYIPIRYLSNGQMFYIWPNILFNLSQKSIWKSDILNTSGRYDSIYRFTIAMVKYPQHAMVNGYFSGFSSRRSLYFLTKNINMNGSWYICGLRIIHCVNFMSI